jgi:hypothetical protein
MRKKWCLVGGSRIGTTSKKLRTRNYGQQTTGKAKNDCSRAQRRGEGREAILFTTRGEIPLELDYAQTYGMGASGAAMV